MRFPKYLIPSWLRRDLIWSQHPNDLVRPTSELVYWSIVTYAMAIFVHVGNLPYWLSLILVAGLVLRTGMEYFRVPLPNTILTSTAALGMALLVFLSFHTVLGRDPGTALVASFSMVKFFEMRYQRDLAFVIFCGYFLVTSALLYSQNFELFFYSLVLFWVLTAVLLRSYSGDLAEHRILPMLFSSGGLLLRALPLTILLFFFFPRFNGSLQLRFGDAQLGLTDSLNPGSFDQLLQDDTPAFRATLVGGRMPTVEQMYWRGIVLFAYDHSQWTVGVPPGGRTPDRSVYKPELLTRQQITVWPHNHNWLFCLDKYEKAPSDSTIRLGPGTIIQLRYPLTVNHKMTYEVDSVVDAAGDQDRGYVTMPSAKQLKAPFFGVNKPSFDFYTNTGSDPIDPRVVALAHRLWGPTPEDCANNIMNYFHKGFIYSADSGAYGENEQYEFLIERKMGYCEHYASAMALLMRINHYPARVVLGYFGGELNPYGFYLVSQSEAHAWIEILSRKRQIWLRYDPVTAIAHENFRASSGQSDGKGMGGGGKNWKLFSYQNLPKWAQDWIQNFEWRRQLWDADWDEWILSFDADTQSDMANSIDESIGGRLIWVVTGVALILSFAWFFVMRRYRPVPDPIETTYDAFCLTLARAGHPREPSESPTRYGARLSDLFPGVSKQIISICEMVSIARYHASYPADLATKLKDALIEFKGKFRPSK